MREEGVPGSVPAIPDEAGGKATEPETPAAADRPWPPFPVALPAHPLFPVLPQHGRPSLRRSLQSIGFRVSSFLVALPLLTLVLVGAIAVAVKAALRRVACVLRGRDPEAGRPFAAEEKRRADLRRRRWASNKTSRNGSSGNGPGSNGGDRESGPGGADAGPDPLVADVGIYARRVGLDAESFDVQTEDGFVLELWHIFDPYDKTDAAGVAAAARTPADRRIRGPGLLFAETTAAEREAREQEMLDSTAARGQQAKSPVLLIPGLLQSAGAYCTNDDDSLAFYLCKAGFDVWLGQNRGGTQPRHVAYALTDPRMWSWTVRHMGVFDLPALASRVLRTTGFARLGLVCHSQATAETLMALARTQRPALGTVLSVFCALAPAAYAGPLVDRSPFFWWERRLPLAVSRLMFGVHSFMPFMISVRRRMPTKLYGWLAYHSFAFLFGWSEARWDRGLRARMFQFSPVHISAEAMRWWLGRGGFADHRCILSIRDEWQGDPDDSDGEGDGSEDDSNHFLRGQPWYDEQAPPMALWVCGRDDLVDGRRLLRRLLPGPMYAALGYHGSASNGSLRSACEPHVRVVHAKILPDFEHLDVLWAVDAVDQVFGEVRDVLWQTCSAAVRDRCRVPAGCSDVAPWVDDARATGRNGTGLS